MSDEKTCKSKNILNYLGKTFISKRVVSYIGLAVALLTIVLSIYFIATLGSAFLTPEHILYNSLSTLQVYLVFFLLLISGLVYIVLFFFNFETIGSAIIGIASFATLIIYIIPVLSYPIQNMMEYTSDVFSMPYLVQIAVFAILVLVLAIVSNVLAYIRPKNKYQVSTSKDPIEILTENLDVERRVSTSQSEKSGVEEK